jgi:hypothetical protein
VVPDAYKYLGCALEVQLARDLLHYPLDVHDRILVRLERLLQPILQLICYLFAFPQLCRARIRHHFGQLDFGCDRFEQYSDRLRIVDVLVSELANELWELTLPSDKAFDRVETFIVALDACDTVRRANFKLFGRYKTDLV